MIFRSILRRTARSSRWVQRNRGSKALRFSHFGWMYSSLYFSRFSESQILGCVATYTESQPSTVRTRSGDH